MKEPCGAVHPSSSLRKPSFATTLRVMPRVEKLERRMDSRIALSARTSFVRIFLFQRPVCSVSAKTRSASSRRPSTKPLEGSVLKRSKRHMERVREVVWIAANSIGMMKREIISGSSSLVLPSALATWMCQVM